MPLPTCPDPIPSTHDIVDELRSQITCLHQQLIESNERYRVLAESLPQYIYRLDRAGRMVFANDAFLSLYHTRLEDLLGLTSWDFLPKELAARHTEENERVMTLNERVVTLEPNVNPQTGQREYMEVIKTPLHDANGQVVGLQGMCWNVTARVTAEESLSETEGWLYLIAEHAPYLVSVVNHDGSCLFSLRGLPIGTSLYDGLSVPDAQTLRQAVTEAFALHPSRCVIQRDGRYWEHRIAPVTHKKHALSAIVFVHDVTNEQELTIRTLQSSRMENLGRLAGGIAHDFNNLLTIILCSASLANQIVTGKGWHYIGKIEQAGLKARDLTSKLLTFSRRRVVTVIRIDLNRVLTDMKPLLRRILPTNITLTTTSTDKAALILADPIEVEQIIMNLVMNARDSMPNGGTIEVAVGHITPETSHDINSAEPPVTITIRDSGHGISAEVLPHIFEPFFTTKGEGDGIGLGLATVYGYIKQCGGSIKVDTQVGHGTIFKVSFPRCVAAGTPIAGEHMRPMVSGKTVRVLVVENDTRLLSLISRVLALEGYYVETAETVRQALSYFAKEHHPIDLALVDMNLPDGTGATIAATAAHHSVPTLIMTSDAGKLWHLFARQPYTILSKPFTPDELSTCITQCLANASCAAPHDTSPDKKTED